MTNEKAEEIRQRNLQIKEIDKVLGLLDDLEWASLKVKLNSIDLNEVTGDDLPECLDDAEPIEISYGLLLLQLVDHLQLQRQKLILGVV